MKFAIWTGSSPIAWHARSQETTGLGGRETAAIEVSRALARRGHDVQLYGQFPDDASDPLVELVQYDRIMDPGQIKCDVFVSSQDKEAIMLRPKARRTCLWVEDVSYGEDRFRHLEAFDKILCVGEWTKNTLGDRYPFVKKNRLIVTRHGIDASRYMLRASTNQVLAHKATMDPSFVYSSAPDKGLDFLLMQWPSIREICPRATLHLCYGFVPWGKRSQGESDVRAMARWLIGRSGDLEQQGVIHHGLISQRELAQLQMDALLWLCPTSSKEAPSITALENMAAGAVPVCTDLTVLSETVKPEHGILIKPFNVEPRYKRDFLAAIQSLVSDPSKREAMARAGREHTIMNRSWDHVASQWEQELAP